MKYNDIVERGFLPARSQLSRQAAHALNLLEITFTGLRNRYGNLRTSFHHLASAAAPLNLPEVNIALRFIRIKYKINQ